MALTCVRRCVVKDFRSKKRGGILVLHFVISNNPQKIGIYSDICWSQEMFYVFIFITYLRLVTLKNL